MFVALWFLIILIFACPQIQVEISRYESKQTLGIYLSFYRHTYIRDTMYICQLHATMQLGIHLLNTYRWVPLKPEFLGA